MLLEPALAPLTLDVADLRFTESTLRQRARPSELTIRLLADGRCELVLVLERQVFGLAADGGYGEPVPPSYVQLAPLRLLANHEVAVDPQDGFPRYRLRTPTTAFNTLTQLVEEFAPGQDWPAFLHAKPEPLLLQDRYFGAMCASGQVNIQALLLAYVQQADAAPSLFAAS